MEEGVIDRTIARNMDNPNIVGLTLPGVKEKPKIIFYTPTDL